DRMLNSSRVSSLLAPLLPLPGSGDVNAAPIEFAPTEILAGHLDGQRFVFCLLALLDIAISKRHPPSWLIDEVADKELECNISQLRLAALLHDRNDVLVGIVPPHQYPNREDVLSRYHDRERCFEQFLDRGVA